MGEYIALDVHKHYSFCARLDGHTGEVRYGRIEHERGAIRGYLADAAPGTQVAVEATGNWYWIVDEIEQAGLRPALVHPYRAKVMMGCVNKTDRLDVDGLNRLQQVGTLPTVWIAPGRTRDLREIPRARMCLTRQRTRLKNRIQATLRKYGVGTGPFSDAFGKGARRALEASLKELPHYTQWVMELLLGELDDVCGRIGQLERDLEGMLEEAQALKRLRSLPGVERILAMVILFEVGDIGRFASAKQFASYCGTVPRVHASGGKVRLGALRKDVNRYLKWAFIEAATCVRLHQAKHPGEEAVQLYRRVARRRGSSKAVGAVARHLAEAAWYVLSRHEDYRPQCHRDRALKSFGSVSASVRMGPRRSGE